MAMAMGASACGSDATVHEPEVGVRAPDTKPDAKRAAPSPPTNDPPSPLVVFDLGDAKGRGERFYYDTQAALAALQGLVNASRPRLFALVPTDPSYEDFDYHGGSIASYDQLWLDALTAWGAVEESGRASRLDDRAMRALLSEARGAVIWHEAVPSTLNAAFTVAGVERLIPIRKDESEGSLYRELVVSGTLPVVRDLAALRSKRETYRWLLDAYLTPGLVSCTTFGYVLDGHFLTNTSGPPSNGTNEHGQPYSRHVYNNQLLSRDYLVAKKALMFDLQPYGGVAPIDDREQAPGADLALLTEILDTCKARLPARTLGTVVGFPNWGWKYAESAGGKPGWEVEWDFAKVISQRYFLKDADAIHPAGMSNASVLSAVPLTTKAPNRPPAREPRYDDARVYVHIHMGDFDSASWIWHHGRFLWGDPARGRYPLSWGFNPNLSERIPVVFRHFFETATANDYFVGGDTGAGYINPGFLDGEGLARWEAHCSAWFEKLGYSATGWSLNGFAGPLSRAVMEAFARCSPMGVVTHDGHYDGKQLSLVGGTPFVGELRDRASGEPIVLDLRNTQPASAIAARIVDNAPASRLVAIRNVLMTPTRVAEVARELEARGAKLVDPHTFFAFAKRRASSLECKAASACLLTEQRRATDGRNPDPSAAPIGCAASGQVARGTDGASCWVCGGGAWKSCAEALAPCGAASRCFVDEGGAAVLASESGARCAGEGGMATERDGLTCWRCAGGAWGACN